MIVSASRRTDIPAWYPDWFFARLEAGFALVRNPRNPRQVSRIRLDRDHVDGFVFWTKNAIPMAVRTDDLKDWPFYFQWTLNPYGKDAEPALPDKKSVLIPAFRNLAEHIGVGRVLWRYDPILFNDRYTPAWHIGQFRALAERLEGRTRVCTVSFLDMYAKTKRNASLLRIRPAGLDEQGELLLAFSEIAGRHGMELRACAEPDLCERTGIVRARCIDAAYLGIVSGRTMKAPQDRNQGRHGCTCSASIDIGAYDTCPAGCRYCYANANPERAAANTRKHVPDSALLFGAMGERDVIRDRSMPLFGQEE